MNCEEKRNSGYRDRVMAMQFLTVDSGKHSLKRRYQLRPDHERHSKVILGQERFRERLIIKFSHSQDFQRI